MEDDTKESVDYIYEVNWTLSIELAYTEGDDKDDTNYICVASTRHILLYINDHFALEDELEDVEVFIHMLHDTHLDIRLRLLNSDICPIASYLRRHPIKRRIKNDLYGFQRTDEYLQTDKDYMKSQSQSTMQRDKDWVDYLASIGGTDAIKADNEFKASPELKQLVRRGIPIAYRAAVWQRISLSSSYKAFFPENYYTYLLESELSKKVSDEIEKDIDRTFPQHEYFSNANTGEDSLRRVLRAFAVHKQDIGYCQSLNFIAAFMLLLMHEEDTFWLLVTMVDTVLPQDYYSNSMIGSNVDHLVFCDLIRTRLPRIHKFLEQNGLEFPLVTLQWFMCLFVNTFRPEVTLRIWDMLFNEGSKVLFRIGIAMLRMREKEILAVRDAGELVVFLNNIGKDIVDADALISCAYKAFNPAFKTSKSPLFGGASAFLNRVSRSSSNADVRGLGVAHKGLMNDTGRQSPHSTAAVSLSGLDIASIDVVLDTLPNFEDEGEFVEVESSSPSPQDSPEAATHTTSSSAGFFSRKFNPKLPVFRMPTLPQIQMPGDSYRNFKRLEIETLRYQLRPKVVASYQATVAAREEFLLRQMQESDTWRDSSGDGSGMGATVDSTNC